MKKVLLILTPLSIGAFIGLVVILNKLVITVLQREGVILKGLESWWIMSICIVEVLVIFIVIICSILWAFHKAPEVK